jgi:hypothetical protein
VAAVALQTLSCSNCGAQLAAPPEGNILRCAYCRAEHVFAPQPAPADRARGGHVPGEAVLVEWGGKWWNANVVEVVGDASWRIHYDGWSDRWDEVVSSERMAAVSASPTPAAEKPTRSGKRVWVALGLAVVAVAAGLVVWASTGSDSVAGPPVPTVTASAPPGSPIAPSTPLAEGEPVWGYSMSQWWRAEIVRPLPNGRYEVRYIGYDKKWNESLAMDQLRRRAD